MSTVASSSVYVLLEKYLGVRFLAWDCTVVPHRSELTLPKMDYCYAPAFMYRETLYFDSIPKEIAARQRLNGPTTECDASVGGKLDFFPYVHSFDDLFPEKEYFKDHPEYYGLQGGKRVAGSVHAQLCLTNSDVLRLAKEKVLKWIDGHSARSRSSMFRRMTVTARASARTAGPSSKRRAHSMGRS